MNIVANKIQELETEVKIQKAVANAWEQAYKLLVVKVSAVSEENIKKVGKRKSAQENYQDGIKYAEKHILPFIKEGGEIEGEVGVQNAWLAAAGSWLREQVVEHIIAVLVRTIKAHAVSTVDWLLGQTEDVILKGYDRLSNEDKFLIKNDLKQYPRFAELLKKIEETEQEPVKKNYRAKK